MVMLAGGEYDDDGMVIKLSMQIFVNVNEIAADDDDLNVGNAYDF